MARAMTVAATAALPLLTLRSLYHPNTLRHYSVPLHLFKTLMLKPFLNPKTISKSFRLSSLPSISYSNNQVEDESKLIEHYLTCSMPGKRLKVAVLISGGVDSSVALRLLHLAGHSCTAFYLKIWFQEDYENFWSACPWDDDLKYAEAVCEQIGVPLEVVHLSEEYWNNVVSYIIEEYRHGRTPNPDVLCNTRIKFGAFMNAISSMKFDYVASGHYAHIVHSSSDQDQESGASVLKLSNDMGAVGLRIRVYDRIMCFVNCHFAAHLEAVNRRNADFDHVYRTMTFNRPNLLNSIGTVGSLFPLLACSVACITSVLLCSYYYYSTGPPATEMLHVTNALGIHSDDLKPELSEAYIVIFLGDLNYRLHGISYEETKDFVSQRCFDWLRERDQLRTEMKAVKVFQGMREALITFPPTYKFQRHQLGLGDYYSKGTDNLT